MCASITKATYTKPAQVWTYVKSTTHNAFGRLMRNPRFTLSSGHEAMGLLTVVIVVFRRLTPAKLFHVAPKQLHPLAFESETDHRRKTLQTQKVGTTIPDSRWLGYHPYPAG